MKKIIYFLIAMVMLLVPLNALSTNYEIVNLDAETYNYSPAPVVSGEDFEIWIQLTNKSNVIAENIEYFLEVEYPFILISENTGHINRLDAYQSKIIKYKLKVNKDALTGSYDLEFKYKREGINIYNIKKYKIDIKGKKAILEIVSSELTQAKIGNDALLTLNLKNFGQKDSKNIFVTLNDSSDQAIKVIGLKTVYLEDLKMQEEKQINFKINISKDVSNLSYTLPITINYSDVDRDYSIERDIGVKIQDNPEMLLKVIKIGEDFKIKPNSEEKISIEVYNIGNVDTEMAYIVISGEAIENTQEFIGSVEKDNYDRIDLNIKTKNIKEKDTKIVVELHYKDNQLKHQTLKKEIDVKINTNNTKGKSNSFFMSVLLVFGIIVGLALFILIARWLIKILIIPAYKVLIGIFKK